jgi:hypothetical protein
VTPMPLTMVIPSPTLLWFFRKRLWFFRINTVELAIVL